MPDRESITQNQWPPGAVIADPGNADVRLADVLVSVRSGKPVTRGLADARNLVLSTARHGRGGRFDVIADGGCGKTRLLDELAAGLRDLGYATLFITISPQREDGGRLSEADRMHGDEVAYHQIIADLASDVSKASTSPAGDGQVPLDTETGRHIEQRMLAAANAMPEQPTGVPPGALSNTSPPAPVVVQQVSPAHDAYVAGGNIIVQNMSDADLLRSRWAASLSAFVAAMREFTEYCPVAVLVDDLHLILGTGAGQWLLGALDQLPGILAVDARRPDAAHHVLGRAEAIRLTPMSEAETGAYLRNGLPGRTPAEIAELGSLVYLLTGGYPVWVSACCQVIAAETTPGTTASQVREQLLGGAALRSPEDLTGSPEDLVARFGRFIDDCVLRLLGAAVPVFDLLTILRRVSRDLLASLLATHGIDLSACGRLFDWLTRSDFMTAIDDGGLSGADEPDIRLHDVIRHQAERLLRRDVTTYRELHASAERYYRVQLNFDQEPEEGLSPFQHGTRYEDPGWQASSLEWLHHAGQVRDKDFPPVMQAMVRLFLDAFFWAEADFPLEGYYHYCHALLADYRALPPRRSGAQWLRYLEAFQENYVADIPNRKPGLDAERWERTRAALRGLWYHLRLDRTTVSDDRNLRRIQVLLSFFCGDAEYFGGTGDEESLERATAWYTETDRAASADEADKWIGNYALYNIADLYLEKDPARTKALMRDLPRRVEEEDDQDLRLYLIWLYGDLAWQDGDTALAFDIYARTVLYAYVYHIRQEFLPQSPSGFTVEQYQMFIDWTRQRLVEAREDGLDEIASTAVGRMNRLFAPYWAHVGRAPDNPEGFPAQPAREDLGRVDSGFAETVLWVLDTMHAQLTEPLDGPLLLP